MSRPAVIADTSVVVAGLLLVTGDKPLLQDAGMQGRVISTQAFVTGA